MKQFLTEHAQDKVLAKWRSLHLDKAKPIKIYIDRFWDLHLKPCVFEEIGFHAQKQQYFAGFPEDMRSYINAQKPKTISIVIHLSMLACKSFTLLPKWLQNQARRVKRLMRNLLTSQRIMMPRRRKKVLTRVPTSLL